MPQNDNKSSSKIINQSGNKPLIETEVDKIWDLLVNNPDVKILVMALQEYSKKGLTSEKKEKLLRLDEILDGASISFDKNGLGIVEGKFPKNASDPRYVRIQIKGESFTLFQ